MAGIDNIKTSENIKEHFKELSEYGIESPKFFSQYEGARVIDSKGESLGKLKDMAIMSGEYMLEVSGIVCVINILGEQAVIPISNILSIDGDVKLSVQKENIPPGKLSENEMLIKETILDQQIVDIDGLKVVRVNDVMLARVNGRICVVGVDVGFKGILRRLWLHSLYEPLLSGIPDQIIPWQIIDPVNPELRKIHLKISREKIQDLHPADIADILEELNSKERLMILKSLDDETAAEALEEIEPEVQATVINNLESEEMADLLENMEPSEAAYILGKMPEDKATEVLEKMDVEDASSVKELMEYEGDTAGGMMTNDFISIRTGSMIPDVFLKLKEACKDINMIYYLYALNENDQLMGVLSLRDLFLADTSQKIDDVMETKILTVSPSTTLDEVVSLLSKYDFVAIPVVDADNVMLGIVMFDDVLDYMLPEDIKKHLPRNYPKSRRLR
jgi:sporulation protein YlmC with PRC-barrel domain